jgi:hypothetical protein
MSLIQSNVKFRNVTLRIRLFSRLISTDKRFSFPDGHMPQTRTLATNTAPSAIAYGWLAAHLVAT